MRIGVPRETKDQEHRVGLRPDGTKRLVDAGHRVFVERGAGISSGFDDASYAQAGAVLTDVTEVWAEAELVVKVKDPSAHEVSLMHPGQVLFAFLHLAAIPEIMRRLREADCIAIAYETIRDADGSFPALRPMSAIAGRIAAQVGAVLLHRTRGGKGLLLGGILGGQPGRVTVLGAGVVGSNAVQAAVGIGAQVLLIDRNPDRLRAFEQRMGGQLKTGLSNPETIERAVRESDLLIGAVYLQGSKAPRLVTGGMVGQMEAGSVIVDVAVDQGGCIETTHPTTHSDPTYFVHDVLHYCVTNMPGAVPRTATHALTDVTFPYLEKLANYGVVEALRSDAALAQGANLWRGGKIVCQGLARSLGIEASLLDDFLI